MYTGHYWIEWHLNRRLFSLNGNRHLHYVCRSARRLKFMKKYDRFFFESKTSVQIFSGKCLPKRKVHMCHKAVKVKAYIRNLGAFR